jgi:6-phosphofructokinase 2
MKTIVTLTLNPAIDIETDVEQVVPLHKLRCGEPRMDPGGGGINVARVIHELGGTAAAIYTKGGSLGNLLRDLLAREGIAEHPVEIVQQTRESFTVNETSSGQQFRFVLPGPALQDSEWRQCLARVAALDPFPDYLVASGSLPQRVPTDFYARLARLLRGQGACLVLDTSGDALGEALTAGVHLIKPNLRELRSLSGQPIESEAEEEAVCRELVERGSAEIVALTLGDRGALLTAKGVLRRAATPKVAVRSPIGAGDSFLGGMTLALARRQSQEEAFLYGMAAGTAAVMTPGTELCRREDVEELFGQISRQVGRGTPGAADGDLHGT